MKLTAIRLHNVRRFAARGVAIESIGDGVNVLSAANEYGKSTFFDALHALFFQAHTGTSGAVQALRPYSGGSPLVEADIATEEGRFRVTKRFYGSKRATVADLQSGRLIAQADEAEQFISRLVRGGTAGPAGLLWVRQGNTGIDKRARSEEESEKSARESVLSSVQGEVETLTGGRRMVEVLAAAQEELGRLVTPTGRPKAGGPLADAQKRLEDLRAEESRFHDEVQDLHEALDARRKDSARLTDIENPEAAAERQQRLATADAAFQSARSDNEALKGAERETELRRIRLNDAFAALQSHHNRLKRAGELAEARQHAVQRRTDAVALQREAQARVDAATGAVESAEDQERQTRDLLRRLEAAMRAQEAAERKAGLADRLAKADAARREVEEGKSALRLLVVPTKAIAELEAADNDLTVQRATAMARTTSLTLHYAEGAGQSARIGGKPLEANETYPITTTTVVALEGIGTLTVTPGLRDDAADTLSAAEDRHRTLLERLKVSSLADLQQRARDAQEKQAAIKLAKDRMALFAPDGIDALREDLARAEAESVGALELKGNPDQAREALESAERVVKTSRNAERESKPLVAKANQALIEAEKAVAAIEREGNLVNEALGPLAQRDEREQELTTALANAEAALAQAQERLAALHKSAADLESAEAALNRARSIVKEAADEAGRLREAIADLNGHIRTRSDGAIEEAWREVIEQGAEAEAVLARLEHEVELLQRLSGALESSRVAAREHYFAPVLGELRPLMGLLFDDASVVFDDKTLLPQTVRRNGLVEDVEHLSGGMREQLAVLTRLAFARLLAREGHPTPVILDDALAYSDDDRIEKMFDALHRQGRTQQIIVFSCRQRAFANLGGNALKVTDWLPSN